MTRIELLRQLQDVTRREIGDILLPVKEQNQNQEERTKTAEVHLMRLPDSSAAKRKAPYIIHQLVTAKDEQPEGEQEQGTAVVRSIFCVYNSDEEAGALDLLALMERVRIALLRKVVIGKQFELDLKAGMEALVYPDDTAPYYAGEMVSTWKLPGVKREVKIT